MSTVQVQGAIVEIQAEPATAPQSRKSLGDTDNNEHVIVKVDDPSGRTSDPIGRQKQQLLEDKYERERRERDYRFWLRRILYGKDDYEELHEKEEQRRIHFWKMEIRRHLAEFFGTYFLVFFVAGIQVNQGFSNRQGGLVANIDKGETSAFILTGLIFCFGNVSGAHFNPIVTLAFALRGAFNIYRLVTYIIVQFAGAVAGAATLWQLVGNYDNLGSTIPAEGLGNTNALGIEILITFVLVSVILSTAVNAKVLGALAALAVGSTFGAIELFAWNFTGASANPWRSIGPIMISDRGWDTYWIYIAGPIVGSVCAVIVHRVMVSGIKREILMDYGTGEGKNGRM